MAARRLVLNGLTAEVGGEACVPALAGEREAGSPDSLEFYHELELYRQLLALPPAPALSEEPAPPRRARTPDPVPTARCHVELRAPQAQPPQHLLQSERAHHPSCGLLGHKPSSTSIVQVTHKRMSVTLVQSQHRATAEPWGCPSAPPVASLSC
ncbi:unnamed protein product [Arctia plantaginis]|uniref:Uncharacterized protein n=1 Tax=Arctia plantaginis TaxID=874455 RepID=A0A8S1BLQ8_ARCPL|nr:unnamed protein product [Arctia plantaginis]